MRKETSTNFENERTLKYECPFIFAISLMGKRWKPAILWKISQGQNRFGQLRRAIRPISEKMLARHLRELERDGLVVRRDFAELPPRVEYYLTERGDALKPILLQLKNWSEENAGFNQRTTK
jgi:DNA-binding HxlR family transcriptional regulator